MRLCALEHSVGPNGAVKTRTFTVFRGHLMIFDCGDICPTPMDPSLRMVSAFLTAHPVAFGRDREKTGSFAVDLLLQKHHYAPVSHLSKQDGLLSLRTARKDGRSTLIKCLFNLTRRARNIIPKMYTLHGLLCQLCC